jgi:hypothetical protein
MVFPGIVAVVALAFSGTLFYLYGQRRKPYQLVWATSFALGAVAAVSFMVFLGSDRAEAPFRLYYVTGALLMAPSLGLGTIYLLAPRRWANSAAAVLAIPCFVGTVLLLAATHLNSAALHAHDVEAGTGLVSGPIVALIALLNTFGGVAVVGGAGFSAWRVRRGRGPRRLLAANLLIAGGTLLASLAGALARATGRGEFFWSILAAGFVVLFCGFMLTLPRSIRRSSTTKN